MTNELITNFRNKLDEVNEQIKILKNLSEELDRTVTQIEKELIKILKYEGIVRYNPYEDVIYLVFSNEYETPENSNIVKAVEFLGADNSKLYTDEEGNKYIKLYYE